MLKRIETLNQTEEAILAAADGLDRADPLRIAAGEALKERGLPTRRVEAWHYTDLRSRLKPVDGLAECSREAADLWVASNRSLIDGARLCFFNGVYLEACSQALPEGMRLDQAAAAGGYRDATDAIALMNTLLSDNGARISVAPRAKVETPVLLAHGADASGAAVLRHAVEIGAGASAVFVERHQSDGAAHTNTVTGLTLEKGARAVWVIAQQEDEAATHLSQLNVTLGEEAQLTILALNAGGALVRREINVVARGEGADLVIRGVNLIGGNTHVDVTTSLVHEVPNTTSSEIFRNVATGNGRGVFQGDIRVAKIAQKTDARMACNTLLLSDEAEFSAKPELEIFADDVQCAHGATVTDIEPDHLFYLRARGIGEREARALLVRAFVEEVFDEVEDEALHDALNAQIEHWLDRHG